MWEIHKFTEYREQGFKNLNILNIYMELIFNPLEEEIDRAILKPYRLYRWQGRTFTTLIEARIARDRMEDLEDDV